MRSSLVQGQTATEKQRLNKAHTAFIAKARKGMASSNLWTRDRLKIILS